MHGVGDAVGGRAEGVGDGRLAGFDRAVVLYGRGRGDRLDAPRVGAHRGAGGDLAEADLRGRRDVRAAAQTSSRLKSSISRTRTNSPYFYRRSARAPISAAYSRVVTKGLHRVVLDDAAVGQVFDLAQLGHGRGAPRLVVEAQPVGSDEGAGLADVVAEHYAQRVVQQVGGGMVAGRLVTAHGVDHRLGALALDHAAFGEAADDDLVGLKAHHVDHVELAGVGVDPAGVGDLAAALGVERRFFELEHHAPVGEHPGGAHHGVDLEAFVAHERGLERRSVALEGLKASPGPVSPAFCAARARSRCLAMRRSKPSSSTLMPLSCTISQVRSRTESRRCRAARRRRPEAARRRSRAPCAGPRRGCPCPGPACA